MRSVMIFLASLIFSMATEANVLQILHTNDLHSHLDHSAQDRNLGGYARLKVKLDTLKAEAAAQNIGTITMDGGDYLEGNIFYLADNGRKSAQAYNQIGYDVAVLGNHDYLMAATDLESLFRDVPPTMTMLAANFWLGPEFPQVNKHVQQVWETEISGVKVGVIGITLNDMIYKWRIKGDGQITSEINAAHRWAKYLRSRGNEIVIALTHIGIKKDKKVAYNVPELDLIIGGHDHTAYQQVVYQESYNGKMIPIVQAGEFGKWIGKVVIDYNKKDKTMKILDYNLHSISGVDKDSSIQDIVKNANDDLDVIFGRDWLETIVGESYLRPKEVANDEATWHFFINDSMKEAMDSDFAVHALSLSGDYPIGGITQRGLYNGNPRHFDLSEKYGYQIYTTYVSGFLIKTVAKICLQLNVPLYFSGLSFKWSKKKNGKYKIWDIRHKGQKIRTFKRYLVAMSEAIVRGGLEITNLVRYIFHVPTRTTTSMWKALEDKFQREGEIHPDYIDTYYRQHFLATGVPMERVIFKP